MKQLLERCKRIFRRNGHGNSTAAMDMGQTMAMSKRPDEDTWKPVKLSDEHKLIILEHQWFKVHPDLPLTKDRESLFGLVPSRLTEDEQDLYFYGIRARDGRRYLEIYNTTVSKTQLREKLASEGLSEALNLFEKETVDGILNAIRLYRSD